MSSWKVHLVDNSHQVWNFWLELHLGEHNYELLRRLHVVLSILQNANVHGQCAECQCYSSDHHGHAYAIREFLINSFAGDF
jgi:hypothetical protein